MEWIWASGRNGRERGGVGLGVEVGVVYENKLWGRGVLRIRRSLGEVLRRRNLFPGGHALGIRIGLCKNLSTGFLSVVYSVHCNVVIGTEILKRNVQNSIYLPFKK